MINLSKFAERLDGLMFEHNLNGKQLACVTGINSTTVTRYLNCKHVPSVKNLVILADYFNCSTDFLLGLEEENQSLKFKPQPPFKDRIVELVKYCNLSEYAFYKKFAIPESSYFEWKGGFSEPTLETVKKLADKLDRRVDFIIGREN